MNRKIAFDNWYAHYFRKQPKDWRAHKYSDTYTLAVVKSAFRAGRRKKKDRVMGSKSMSYKL